MHLRGLIGDSELCGKVLERVSEQLSNCPWLKNRVFCTEKLKTSDTDDWNDYVTSSSPSDDELVNQCREKKI
ncbi:Hypothetical protein CINCED_3A016015 [Cinara cedri]|uniref:Uncharacterized protein n=1 Tax=Cinara cedri TaxID=506608 RepID=A0A5E4M480_9HEMI|nr:Hypothetical protein CINCED_3A016015 [Cinara cedri]